MTRLNILKDSIKSLTIVSITAIIAIMICCLATLGFNSKITILTKFTEFK